MNFGRMTIRVDDEPIDVLLDTGATARLSDEAAATFGLPADTLVGTSFIDKSVFDRWVARHPHWLVIERGDKLGSATFPMIRVPEVMLADRAVGPVWFSERPDRNFRVFMSGMMDAPIDGAVGGSAFRYTRMVIDYPGSAVYFYGQP